MTFGSFPWLPLEEIVALSPAQIEAVLRRLQKNRDQLTKARAQLTAKLVELSRDEVRAEMMEQRLSQALTIHRNRELGLPSADALVAAMREAAPGARAKTLSANVLVIVRQARGASVTPQGVRHLLAENGIEAQEKSVRQALRRLADDGMVVKDGRTYRSID